MTGIEAGDPLLTSGEPDVAPIPTLRVSFKTQERWFGDIAEEFQVFKTGTQAVWLDGDPPYAVGQSYALLLDRRSDGAYVAVSPEGRLEVRGGRVHSLVDGPVPATLHGRTVNDARERMLRARGA